jgi:parvulin-like peptidyl-prolyl isomerase
LLKKWLREPLLHFLLFGGLLFLLYGLQNPGVDDNSDRIVITEADIDRLIALWERRWQRPPTQLELEGLIEQQIREEVLYREALAMGLDQNDTIVRRRLAQKVEFISADLAAQAEPTEADLAEYLAAHADKFEVPGRISFVHVYLNADKRGARVQEDAQRLLEELTRANSDVDIMAAGDPFMLGQEHEQLTEQGVARLLGNDFAGQLFGLPVGAWQGPVASGYGLHLVRIDSKSSARQPQLDAVRDRVRDEWLSEQRRTLDEAFYSELRKRYEITVESSARHRQKLAGSVTE